MYLLYFHAPFVRFLCFTNIMFASIFLFTLSRYLSNIDYNRENVLPGLPHKQ